MSSVAYWLLGLCFVGLALVLSLAYKFVSGNSVLVSLVGKTARLFFKGFTVLFVLIFIATLFMR